MIRVIIQDSECPVELLHKDEANHLMRECHLRKRNLFLRSLINLRSESVRATDDEHQSLVYRMHLAFYPVGKLDGAELLAMLIEEHHYVARL